MTIKHYAFSDTVIDVFMKLNTQGCFTALNLQFCKYYGQFYCRNVDTPQFPVKDKTARLARPRTDEKKVKTFNFSLKLEKTMENINLSI